MPDWQDVDQRARERLARQEANRQAGIDRRADKLLGPDNADPFKSYAYFDEIYGRSPSPEDKLGRYGLMELIGGRGFAPGEFDQILSSLTQDLQRAGGVRTGLQSALMNQRFAGLPGGGGTAFQDAAYSDLVRGQQDAANQALSQARMGLTQFGLDTRNQALSQLFASEENAAARRKGQQKFTDYLGDIANIGVGIASAATGNPAGAAQAAKGATSAATRSSIDYKKNVAPASTPNLLDAVKGLNVVDFQFKEGMQQNGVPEDPNKPHVGLLAEEAPDMIKADEKSLSMPDMIGMLMGALQELTRQFEALKAELGRGGSQNGNSQDFQTGETDTRIY